MGLSHDEKTSEEEHCNLIGNEDDDQDEKVRTTIARKKTVSFNPHLQNQSQRSMNPGDADQSRRTSREDVLQNSKPSLKKSSDYSQGKQFKHQTESFEDSRASSAKKNRMSLSEHEIELHRRDNIEHGLVKTHSVRMPSAQTVPDSGFLTPLSNKNSGMLTKSSNIDGQSFYTAVERSVVMTAHQSDSEFQSALESNTPYLEMVDRPRILISDSTSRSHSTDGYLVKPKEINSPKQLIQDKFVIF